MRGGDVIIDLTKQEMETKTLEFFDMLLIHSVNPKNAKEMRIPREDYEKLHFIRMVSVDC